MATRSEKCSKKSRSAPEGELLLFCSGGFFCAGGFICQLVVGFEQRLEALLHIAEAIQPVGVFRETFECQREDHRRGIEGKHGAIAQLFAALVDKGQGSIILAVSAMPFFNHEFRANRRIPFNALWQRIRCHIKCSQDTGEVGIVSAEESEFTVVEGELIVHDLQQRVRNVHRNERRAAENLDTGIFHVGDGLPILLGQFVVESGPFVIRFFVILQYQRVTGQVFGFAVVYRVGAVSLFEDDVERTFRQAFFHRFFRDRLGLVIEDFIDDPIAFGQAVIDAIEALVPPIAAICSIAFA